MPRHKHTPVIIHGSDLYNAMSDSFSDEEMAEELDVELDEDGNCPCPSGWYLVIWPDHVITPRCNSDASFHKLDESLAEIAADPFHRNHIIVADKCPWETIGELVEAGMVERIAKDCGESV